MKVIEVPFTTASLLGENKVGAEGREGVFSTDDEQANPEKSNRHTSTTMIILEFFIFYLSFNRDASSLMLRNRKTTSMKLKAVLVKQGL